MVQKASSNETNEKIFNLVLNRIDNCPLKIADMGCGTGFLLNKLRDYYVSRGWNPFDYLSGFDIDIDAYNSDVPVRKIDLNQPLLLNESYDLILCLEVLEHSRRPYTLLDDFNRILNPGGEIICSVPNIGNISSRLKFLFRGGFQMYFGPSVEVADAGKLSGHINTMPIQYWTYGLRTACFKNIQFSIDRMKSSCVWLTVLLAPFLLVGNLLMHREERKYSESLYKKNAEYLSQVNSFNALVGRTLIFVAKK
jgi:SAM-dependent methyltransferase